MFNFKWRHLTSIVTYKVCEFRNIDLTWSKKETVHKGLSTKNDLKLQHLYDTISILLFKMWYELFVSKFQLEHDLTAYPD